MPNPRNGCSISRAAPGVSFSTADITSSSPSAKIPENVYAIRKELTVQMGQNPGNHGYCKDKHSEPKSQVSNRESLVDFVLALFHEHCKKQNRQMSDTVNRPLANLIQSRLPELISANWREVLHSSTIAGATYS